MLKQFSYTLLFSSMLSLSMMALAGHPGEEVTGMKHPPLMMPQELATPSLALSLNPDAMSGYNLTLALKLYQLIPPQLASQSKPKLLEGHAHLTINGKKIQRVYGKYLHLPSGLFIEGVNQITVSLNNHDHQAWQLAKGDKKGEVILATLIIDTRHSKLIVSHYSSSE